MMKKTVAVVLSLMLFALGGCGEDGKIENQPSENSPNTGDQGSNMMSDMMSDMQSGEGVLKYDEGGVSFDVPASWQKNFKAVTNEVGSGDNKYTKTDFLYNHGERDIMVMSVGRFTKAQWEEMKKREPKTEEAKLGETNDYVYSVFYENHDYVDDDELRDILKKVRDEASSLRSTIKLK